MAWSAPRTWVTDEIVTASLMNQEVRDNLLVLSTHRHSGASGDGDQDLGPIDYVVFDDLTGDPAAPGADKMILYYEAGELRFRAGAAGAATALSDETHTHSLTEAATNTGSRASNSALPSLGNGVAGSGGTGTASADLTITEISRIVAGATFVLESNSGSGWDIELIIDGTVVDSQTVLTTASAYALVGSKNVTGAGSKTVQARATNNGGSLKIALITVQSALIEL